MTDRMTSTSDRVEIITSVQRRRRWTAAEKMRLVEATFAPGMTVSLVARQNGVNPNQLFTWRRLAAQGALTATGAEEEGCACLGLPRPPEPSARIAGAARQEDLGSRSPERGVGGGRRTQKGAVAV